MIKRSKTLKKEGHYGNLRLLMALAFEMTRSDGMTISEIADFLGCSRRTAQRTKESLYEIFTGALEIVDSCEKEKHWRIKKTDLVKLESYTAQDVILLRQAEKLFFERGLATEAERMKYLAGKINFAAKKTSTTLDAEVLSVAEGFACRPGVRQKVSSDILENIRFGILGTVLIDVTYFNKKSGKTNVNRLEPYGILYSDRTQYLLARHADGYFGDEIHQFLLANIQSVAVTQEMFVKKDFDINEYVKDAFGVYREKPFNVEWKFSAKAAKEAENFIFHPDQTMQYNDDGTLTVCFKAGGVLEMAWHLYTWGNEVEVVKPVDFWQRVEKAENNRW